MTRYALLPTVMLLTMAHMLPTVVLKLVMIGFAVELFIKFVVGRRAEPPRELHAEPGELPWRYRVADDLRQPYSAIVEAARYDVIAELMLPPEPLVHDVPCEHSTAGYPDLVVAASRGPGIAVTQAEIDAARRRLEGRGWWYCPLSDVWNPPGRRTCVRCSKRRGSVRRIVEVSLASPPASGAGRYTSDVGRTKERASFPCAYCGGDPCDCYDDVRSLLP